MADLTLQIRDLVARLSGAAGSPPAASETATPAAPQVPGPTPSAPPGDRAAGLSAASLANWSQRGEVVEIASRTLGGTVYVVPDLESVAPLVGSGVPRGRVYTAVELAELVGLFTLDPPQRAAALRVLDAVREVLGPVEVVAVRPAAKHLRTAADKAHEEALKKQAQLDVEHAPKNVEAEAKKKADIKQAELDVQNKPENVQAEADKKGAMVRQAPESVATR
jgi:hypothetical protein